MKIFRSVEEVVLIEGPAASNLSTEGLNCFMNEIEQAVNMTKLRMHAFVFSEAEFSAAVSRTVERQSSENNDKCTEDNEVATDIGPT